MKKKLSLLFIFSPVFGGIFLLYIISVKGKLSQRLAVFIVLIAFTLTFINLLITIIRISRN